MFCHTTGLGERGVPAEAIGERAAGELMDALASGACSDEWLQDQLIIFMALAKVQSVCLPAPRLCSPVWGESLPRACGGVMA